METIPNLTDLMLLSPSESILESLILNIPLCSELHVPGSMFHKLCQSVGKKETHYFSDKSKGKKPFGVFGEISFPYIRMGKSTKLGRFDSIGQFYADELILFSFYFHNRNIYKNVLDLGANIGLHSLIMAKCGFKVKSFEPDPLHYSLLQKTLNNNDCSNVEPINAAISVKNGTTEFVRVCDNTTASHIANSKNAYGELEKFEVKTVAFSDLQADLIKMDVEGHEKDILVSTNQEFWNTTDALIEVLGDENAIEIFNHFIDINVNLFSQKIGWKKVSKANEIPVSWKEGSLFITMKAEMPWGK
jgi:FkbM family methyltransferase